MYRNHYNSAIGNTHRAEKVLGKVMKMRKEYDFSEAQNKPLI